MTEEERKERHRAAYKAYYERNREEMTAKMRERYDPEQRRDYYAAHCDAIAERNRKRYTAKKQQRNKERLEELKEQIHPSFKPLVDSIINSPYLTILTNNELVVVETVVCLTPSDAEISTPSSDNIITHTIV